MKATLALNNRDQLALFYNRPLGFTPEWASVDVAEGEIYIGGSDAEHQSIKLDQIDQRIYSRVQHEAQIFLVLVKNHGAREPLEALFVPLTISRQI